MCEKPIKAWHCPWGLAMVDDIAPAFKVILEENYLLLMSHFEDTKHNRMLLWKQITNIDHRLDKFLRFTTV
jgi:separase